MKKYIILLLITVLFLGCDQTEIKNKERIKAYNAVKEIFPTSLIMHDKDEVYEFVVFDTNGYKLVIVEPFSFQVSKVRPLIYPPTNK